MATTKKKSYSRSGKTIAQGVFTYPKRYEIRIEPDSDGMVRVYRTNENFGAYELYGHLRMALLDLEKQLSYPTTDSALLEKRK